jgi:hypothetical protein
MPDIIEPKKKTGSGRTKGAFSYALVSIAQLKTKIADENMVFPVSRRFCEGLGLTNLVSKSATNLTDSIEGQTPQTAVGATVRELE